MKLWQVDIRSAEGQPDALGSHAESSARELGIADHLQVTGIHGFLLQGTLEFPQVQEIAKRYLADPIAQASHSGVVGDGHWSDASSVGISSGTLIHVLFKPGVMDPVAQSTLTMLRGLGYAVDEVRTFRKYWIHHGPARSIDPTVIDRLSKKVLSNDSIEQVVIGPLALDRLSLGTTYDLKIVHVPIQELDEAQLMQLSKSGQLYLSLAEMQTVQNHFRELGREPTDIELETIAQTWSEHCSHKTLGGRIEYRDDRGVRNFSSMLKETIFAATKTIRERLGAADWCVSVFKDNAGVVKFDDEHHVVFKVETHNHPSAIEPYGGANTGLGGVIRDPLGTGLGAKPICSTDVFCFASPSFSPDQLPPGVLHPRRVMTGVVAGVRDYGNRMGIPTVNGAVYFDDRYLGNPLVYCGNAGTLPVDKVEKAPQAGDWIVAIGGRTGRDGIHGATFSSVELTHESESISGGSVQIGNAITEKMVLDVILQARDEGLYHAVTDCGAGGFSSAVGEMGENIGAEVWLDRAPVKYSGLSYTEIWISEAQERMVLAVPPEHLERLAAICKKEDVEFAVIGQFVPTGRLRLMYDGQQVGLLQMDFLHGGRPPVIRKAVYQPIPEQDCSLGKLGQSQIEATLKKILAHPTVASKHWIIRQYDHEVQGGSVVKPLVGPSCNGPSDAAVVRPKLNSSRGIVLSCGMNPRFGDIDPYHMATSAIDEAVRNAIAVGARPDRIAILDNFCWGNTDRPETLGTLVRAAVACHDLAVAWNTPFISGKDSLNNEFTWIDGQGEKQSIAIPCSLLISAMGQIDDVTRAVTMDLKRQGNRIYVLGVTRNELGGSHAAMVLGLKGGYVPKVDAPLAMRIYERTHQAIQGGCIVSCHDASEGGLAVAVSEMAFAGELGIEMDISDLRQSSFVDAEVALFSESNSRLICEVPEAHASAFEAVMSDVPCYRVGIVTDRDRVEIKSDGQPLVDLPWSELRATWLAPLDLG
ncbi:MAG: phosphoribosylformylglycinamidine synthase subunit PurL [Pirellula sp.]|nr:phosphoribosylformylglycinamidine synthase subunit PurL [Pirellula sp.]